MFSEAGLEIHCRFTDGFLFSSFSKNLLFAEVSKEYTYVYMVN
jgi:hypothetical protein